MLNGVILQKLQSLDQALAELRSLGKISIGQLQEDWRTRRAIERNLQVMVEVVIDVCQRVISLAGQTPVSTGREAVERCVRLGVLSRPEMYEKMIQFRNFIVHRYERVDVEIIVDIITRRLEDFERFRNEVLAYVQAH